VKDEARGHSPKGRGRAAGGGKRRSHNSGSNNREQQRVGAGSMGSGG